MLIRVADVVCEGPATSRDVADELGISLKSASAYLSELFAAGALKRIGPLIFESGKYFLYYDASSKEPAWATPRRFLRKRRGYRGVLDENS